MVPGLGEVDNSGFLVDQTDPASPIVVCIMFEVKNTRAWFYADDPEVLLFLRKAAHVQAARPEQLVLPVFLCRKVQYTLWERGERDGFLPARVENQLVLPDYELTPTSFAEVRDELFRDLVLGDQPTNRHQGTVRKAIPKYAFPYATRWQNHYMRYLP